MLRIASAAVLIAAGFVSAGIAAPAAPRLLVTSQDDASISEIDPRVNRVVARIALAAGPAGIGVGETCDRVAISHPDGKVIELLDVATGRVRKLAYKGEPFGVVVDGEAVYVSDWSKDEVVRLDAETGRATGTARVGKSPAGLVIDRGRHRLYVANRESGGVSVIDSTTMKTLASVPSGTAPFALAVAPDGKRLYVANVRSGDIAVIDATNLTRVATVRAGAMPYGVAVTPDNATVLVTNQHGNSLSLVDVARLEVVATIPVGRYPEGVTVVDGRAYVANWFSADVSVVDLAQRRETGRIKVGDGPRYFVVLHAGAAETC